MEMGLVIDVSEENMSSIFGDGNKVKMKSVYRT